MTPKDVLTNKHFCPMPWTGLMYNFDGTVKNCIRSDDRMGNIKDTAVEDIVLGSKNVTKQTNIINNTPATGCHTCYDLEHGKTGLDIISDRIFYIREFKKTSLDTTNQTILIYKLLMFVGLIYVILVVYIVVLSLVVSGQMKWAPTLVRPMKNNC
jgi:hypothetical protein